ncbi:hypothetical protein FRB90_001563 [Tulasnella sp. 427]|nr:hypothetical protein FRB90_001563 [Tulasnella sp. 427]
MAIKGKVEVHEKWREARLQNKAVLARAIGSDVCGGPEKRSTGGTRYFDIRPPPQAPTAPGSNAPGGQVTSASPASSYTNATPTQQYTQPQPVYDAQGYVQTPLPPPHHYPHAHHQHHESQLGHQQHATEVEVTSSFQNQPQQPQQQHHQSPYVAPSSSTTSSVTALRQQHQRHQNPQFVLPPPPSFRQPTLPYLPAHPDGVIPHYTFGASPLNESDYAAPKRHVPKRVAARGPTQEYGAGSQIKGALTGLPRGNSDYPSTYPCGL